MLAKGASGQTYDQIYWGRWETLVHDSGSNGYNLLQYIGFHSTAGVILNWFKGKPIYLYLSTVLASAITTFHFTI